MFWQGCGTAQVDGVLSPGEWSGAATKAITVNTPAGPVPGTLYVMNDEMNMFFAVKFAETTPHYGSLGIELDSDHNLAPSAGDDGLVYNNQVGFFDDVRTATAFPEDVSQPNGLSDGQGAYVNDGTNSVYEISHPFRGFDGYDIQLQPGIAAGFYLLLRIVDGPTLYDTYFPGPFDYDFISIGLCRAPLLSGCGTPTIDGRIAPGEWATAGHAQFSVMTPQGKSSAGTLYVMNDSFNLYMALAYAQPALPAWSLMSIRFDNDNSGGYSFGDDAINFSDGLGQNGFTDAVFAHACYPFGMCFDYDTNHGGTVDGSGALANDGTLTAYEFAHPINSGDINDIALAFGDTIGYSFIVSMSSSTSILPPDRGDTTTYVSQLQICTPGPTQSGQDLSRQVSSLSSGGSLSPKNADTLLSDLSKANRDLKLGKNKQAANDFGDFIRDVTKMMRKGEVANAPGQQLINVATTAMSQL